MLIHTRRYALSRRGAFLALFGIVWVLIGYSLLTVPAAATAVLKVYLRLAFTLAPVEVYGWAWIGCGAVAILGGLWHRYDGVGFAVGAFMPAIWSAAYWDAQLQYHAPRAWVSGVVYSLLAVAVWIVAGMADPLDDGRRFR